MTTSMSCSMNRKVTSWVVAQVVHVLEQAPAEGRVDPGHRLVEQQRPGLGHQRPGELQQLALPAGEGACVVVLLGGQVEPFEQLERRAPRPRPRGASSPGGG